MRGGQEHGQHRISIHALREESDQRLDAMQQRLEISIHALREESDSPMGWDGFGGKISIHALREESDSCRVRCWSLRLYFNPRPPRGERQEGWMQNDAAAEFQSTPSARRATERASQAKQDTEISIHALREESDCTPSLKVDPHTRFQSTPSARRATETRPSPWSSL